jgi:hypothetical protein
MRNPQLKIATEAEAKAMDQEAIRLIAEVKSGWLCLGLLIDRMATTRAFAVLGFPSMHSWMQRRLGESLSSAYSALRSVRALKGVSEEKLNRIGERNAHALTRLPERERKSHEWIEKAATSSTKEFKLEVEIALEEKTGLPREKFKTFWIALPEAVFESMCEAEKKLAWTLGIDIETNPANRILVWEAWAQWILQTDEQTIKAQTEGL